MRSRIPKAHHAIAIRAFAIRALAIGAALTSVAPTGVARADPGPDPAVERAETAVAREAGEQGLSLFNAGRWQEAYDRFDSAEAVLHAPTLVLFMAHCQKRLGR